jgi:hypothetical protein
VLRQKESEQTGPLRGGSVSPSIVRVVGHEQLEQEKVLWSENVDSEVKTESALEHAASCRYRKER